MRQALSLSAAGSILSNKILWWELLADASECWASRFKKSFWGSSLGTLEKNDAVAWQCRQQAQALSFSDNSIANCRRDSYETYAAFGLNTEKRLLKAQKGFISTLVSVGASICECRLGRLFSYPLSRGAPGIYQMSAPFARWVSLDALPDDHGWPSDKLFIVKKMQQSLCPDGLPEMSPNLGDKTHMAFRANNCKGLVNTGEAVKASSKRMISRVYLSGSFGCLKDMHVLPVILFGRAFSTSTKKQFDDDAGDSQSTVLGQQHSSLGGQQSSLEILDSKPAGGPSWPNPDNAASYVLMSNIYADGDRWDEVKRINEMRLKARAWKKPGKAYVEIQAKVHEFIVGDRTHQESTNIYEKLRKIKRHMGHIGYVPYVDLVLENRSYHDPYSKPR